MNGLARKINDVDFQEYVKKYDLILLSETWLNKKQPLNTDINGYISYHVYGNKRSGTNKGRFSGGLSIYYKNELSDNISIVETNQYGIVWLKLKQDLFSVESDMYLCHTYIPPVNSKVLIDQDFDFFYEIEKGVEKYGQLGKTCITGDLNSRTGNLSDILEYDKYLDCFEELDTENINTHFPVIRNNPDKVIDCNGKRLINLCRATNHIIVNGRLNKEQDNQFTFVSNRGLSITDYLIINANYVDNINEFQILNWQNFSDHAGVYFSLKCNTKTRHITTGEYKEETKLVFNSSFVEKFQDSLKENINLLNENKENINCEIKHLTSYIYDNAVTIFGKKVNINHDKKIRNKADSQKWFDYNCNTAKKEFKRARNIFNKLKTDENKTHFVNMRTKYNKIRKKSKAKYKKIRRKKT